MSPTDPAALTAFAHRLADAAAEVTLAHFRQGASVGDKAGEGHAFDPVTIADRDAEHAIRRMIEVAYPDHAIVGEEHPEREGSSGYAWFIDPIDGTRSYISGVPLWGTLIGLEHGGTPLIGVADQPYIGERFTGGPDGAWLENRQGRARLSASRCTDLAAAKLGTTSPFLFAPGDRERFAEVQSRVRLARYGGDFYFYALLAAGQVDLVIESGLHPFDVVALIPIIAAAGGVMTDWDGRSAARGGRILAAATPELHRAAQVILTGA